MRNHEKQFCPVARGSSSLEEILCEPERCPWWVRELEACAVKVAAASLFKLTQ